MEQDKNLLSQILSINFSSLNEDDAEDLCPKVLKCNVDDVTDANKLQILIKIFQQILQYKNNQVDALLIECKELKEESNVSKSTIGESRKDRNVKEMKYNSKRKDQNLIDENIKLKHQLFSMKEQLENTTINMNETQDVINLLLNENAIYQDRIMKMENSNSILLTQVAAITTQQMNSISAVDNFSTAIDSRVTEWKKMLDEKNSEIAKLKENLSNLAKQSESYQLEDNNLQLRILYDDIEQRDIFIAELQNKLSDATAEICDNTILIDKLINKTELMKAYNEQNREENLLAEEYNMDETIQKLQTELTQTEAKLCKTLSILTLYKEKNPDLTEILQELEHIKNDLHSKNEYIENLVRVINKLEMLCSHKETKIVKLRKKLKSLDNNSDPAINISPTCENNQKKRKINHKDKFLTQTENDKRNDQSNNIFSQQYITDDESISEIFNSTKILNNSVNKGEINNNLTCQENIDNEKANVKYLIEENNALREGMHEILESIRHQDGKTTVKIHSNILEKLLEALDTRHLAGWYHPAMRLLQRLNKVQGSNNELRSQLKHLSLELQQKDLILQDKATSNGIDIKEISTNNIDTNFTKRAEENLVSEHENLIDNYGKKQEEWDKIKNMLEEENFELKNLNIQIRTELDIYKQNWKGLKNNNGINGILKANVEALANGTIELCKVKQKLEILQEKLNMQSAKLYFYRKQCSSRENNLRSLLCDAQKYMKLMEYDINILKDNLSNTVSISEYEGLRDKCEELSLQLRAASEFNIIHSQNHQNELLKIEMELLKKENTKLIEIVKIGTLAEIKDGVEQDVIDLKAAKLQESQRADRTEELCEALKLKLEKYENDFKKCAIHNNELQQKLSKFQNKVRNKEHKHDISAINKNEEIKKLKDEFTTLLVENENLQSKLDAAQEEARFQCSLNLLKNFEFHYLRNEILDLQMTGNDKITISRLSYELSQSKMSEIELNTQKIELENKNHRLKEEVKNVHNKNTEIQNQMLDLKTEYNNRCREYADVISFLQCQYAGFTPLSTLNRIMYMFNQINIDRREIYEDNEKIKDFSKHIIIQQELLSNRLEIIERLKDILEQKIGNDEVEDIFQYFSEWSQLTSNAQKYKRVNAYLRNELEVAKNALEKYEVSISKMENEMINMQRIWRVSENVQEISKTSDKHCKTTSTQSDLGTNSVHVQTELSIQIHENEKFEENNFQESNGIGTRSTETNGFFTNKDLKIPVLIQESDFEEKCKIESKEQYSNENMNFQLNEALELVSFRTTTLMKYESQIAENKAKIDALHKELLERESHLIQQENVIKRLISQIHDSNTDCKDRLILKSIISSLRKIISQKENTILRYQNLMKKERDNNTQNIINLQKELKMLRRRFSMRQKNVGGSHDRLSETRLSFSQQVSIVEGEDNLIDNQGTGDQNSINNATA